MKVEELGHGLHFDEAQLRLTNRRTGMSYGIGDKIRIQIAATDILTFEKLTLSSRHAKKKAMRASIFTRKRIDPLKSAARLKTIVSVFVKHGFLTVFFPQQTAS